MSDLLNEMAKDAGAPAKDTSGLAELKPLVDDLLKARQILDDLEDRVQEQKRIVQEFETKLIPDKCNELGLQSFVLDNGLKFELRRDYQASIPKEKTHQAYTWLESNGFGDLIKTTIETQFGRGELDEARALQQALSERFGVQADLKESVHHSTLKAFVRERMEEGEELPDSISVFETYKVKIR